MTMRKHLQISAESHSIRRRTQRTLTAGLMAALIATGGSPLASLADISALSPMPISEVAVDMPLKYAHYQGFTGVIESVTPHHSLKDTLMLRVHAEGESPADFVITKGTVLSENVVLDVGQTITGWYDTRKPMILIYPPQYAIELVTYRASTRSLPAQTLPESVYVMEEDCWLTPAGQVPVLVGGRVVHGPSVQVLEDQTVMVPLRAVAEALGLEVHWLPETQTVMVGKASMTIGQDAYAFARMAPVALGTAPIVHEGRTFVPMRFFGQVLPGVTTEIKEGKVWVNVNPES